MRQQLLFGLVVVAFGGCGEVEQSVNPSDIANAGTGLAIISSIGLGEFDTADDNTTVNNTTGTTNFMQPDETLGTAPFNLDCSGSITVSGARDESFAENSGCGAGLVGGMSTSISWTFGVLERVFALSELPTKAAGDLSNFEVSARYTDLSVDPNISWETVCTVSLTSSVAYVDDEGETRAVWIGSASCQGSAPEYSRASALDDWETTGGAPLDITSFEFETPYPSG